jgi:ATP-dependent DNA ligase
VNIGLLSETFDPEPLLADSGFVAEEKIDGMRLAIVKTGNVVSGWTRNGVEWTVPAAVRALALENEADFIADGELVGDTFTAFDVLSWRGEDATRRPLVERRAILLALPFAKVRQATTEKTKRALFGAVRAEGGEGIVFKPRGAYADGREYGIKFKFYLTEQVKVASVDIARGVAMTAQGNVTFPLNSQWPKAGDFIEVRFDKWSKAGKMMRPVFQRVRGDLAVA